MMTLPEITEQSVVIAGLGLSGMACLRFLRQFNTPLTLWDTRPDMVVPEHVTEPLWRGDLPNDFWHDKQVLVVSPGLSLSHPEIQRAQQLGLKVIGEIELFALANKVKTVGITGTNGKTTVTLLVTHILNCAGVKAMAGGNVGTAALDLIGQDGDVYVLELSSFQLESTHSLCLESACILNLTDDHLDRHGSMQAYAAAKQRIFVNAKRAVVWRQHPILAPQSSIDCLYYDLAKNDVDFGLDGNFITWQGRPVLDVTNTPLVGEHNILNLQAAMAMTYQLGVPVEVAAAAVSSFTPAPHRCETVLTKDGITWVDDSKATNVGATLAALTGLIGRHHGRIILIAGGDAKGADLQPLHPALSQIALTITLGRDGSKIAALAPRAQHVASMSEAVQLAAENAIAGDMVLLSPACASLDMFTSYVHRAQVFRQEVLRRCNAE